MVHGEERLAPVAGSVGQRIRLFAVEHGMGVHDLGSHLLGNSGEDDVTTALISSLVVVLCDVRDLGHLAHECAGHDVAAAAVGKGEAGDHGNAADVDVVSGVDLVAQPMDQSRPDDVGVGLSKDVPLLVGAQLPGAHNHVDKLELVQLPAAVHAGGAVLLRDGAFLLGLVELELVVLFLDLVVDAVEGIVDVVLANLLLLLGVSREAETLAGPFDVPLPRREYVCNSNSSGNGKRHKDTTKILTRSEKMRKSSMHCRPVSNCVGSLS